MARISPRKSRGSGGKGIGKQWSWVLIAVALATALFFWGRAWLAGTSGGAVDRVSIAQGEQLFAQNCAVCHGPQARGEDPAQSRGGVKPGGSYLAPALNGTGHAWHHGPDQLFRIVKEGSPAEKSTMKGWQGRMSDAEIRAVIAYFQTLWPPPVRGRYTQAFGQ